MSGCDTKPEPPGDDDAWKKDILKWALGGGVLAGILAYLNIAGASLAGFSGGAALVALAAIAVAIVAGAIVGGFVGYAVEWFKRLKVQSPSTITISALIECAGRNTGGIPPFADGDWTFNAAEQWAVTAPAGSGLTMDEVRTRAAPGSGLPQAYKTIDPDDPANPQVFHVEISSQIGNFGAVGSAVGSVAGAIAGAIAGAALCAAVAAFTFGLGIALCALFIALGAMVGAAVGGLLGAAIGAGIGWIADQFGDFNKLGESVERGCQMFLTGRWVTDINHQHNEIHDLAAAVLIECGVTGSSSSGLEIAGAVGTGRHPGGRDP
jgi:hypothetical protein